MESDIKLQDGTVDISGDLLHAAMANLELYARGGHLTTKDGNVELSSDSGTVKMTASNLEIYYCGGHLLAKGGNIELGSTDKGPLRGIAVSPTANTITCSAGAVMVLNPDVKRDSKPRLALEQSPADELVINANGSYPGGVKFEGSVNMSSDVTVQTSLSVAPGGKLLLRTPDHVQRLPNGKTVRLPGEVIDVLATIAALRDSVKQLEDKVAALTPK